MDKFNIGDEVNVVDDSYCLVKTKNGLEHKTAFGGYLQNRNPWIIVAFAVGLPANNECYDMELVGDKQYNNVIIQHATGIIASTQVRFLRNVE